MSATAADRAAKPPPAQAVEAVEAARAVEAVRPSLFLAGCGRPLHELCLALDEVPRKLTDDPPAYTAPAAGPDRDCPATLLLDPRSTEINIQRLIDRLQAADQDLRLILVGTNGDPIVELFVDYLAIHHIPVDGILRLPTTVDALGHSLAQARARPGRGRARPDAPDWTSPGAATFRFQPQFCARTLRQTGAEALARIHHPQLGVINPLGLPDLRHNQRYLDGLFWEALDQSLGALRAWSGQGYAGTVSINVSAATLRQTDLAASVDRKVDAYGLRPDRLVLELVESEQVEDDTVTCGTLLQLSQSGYRLSMDDFGQGYSSLWQLSRIPFGEVKIDRGLTARLGWSDKARKLIPAIIAMARQLDIDTVGEGVEDRSQLDFLSEHGCHGVQGFFLDPSQQWGCPE